MTAVSTTGDRFGITWHPSIAAAVVAHLDRLDLVEVIPEGRFLDQPRAIRALRRLARTLPVSIHGVSLGLASMSPVEPRRLERLARLVGEVEPESWSEHLAFVRSGNVELEHLAAPPRTAATVESVAEHVELARRHVGSWPRLENVATTVGPPGDCSEEAWLLDVLRSSPADLLLDLHNLYVNSVNERFDAEAFLQALPVDRIRTIHIAGGIDVRTPDGSFRRIDDHLHDVPEVVYALLTSVGAMVPHPIDVVLERDGDFPPISHLLAQLERAREALARGRALALAAAWERQAPHGRPNVGASVSAPQGTDRVDTAGANAGDVARLEAFLAALFTDECLRARFLASPLEEAARAGLSPHLARRLAHLDPAGLELAAAGFASKRRAAERARGVKPF